MNSSAYISGQKSRDQLPQNETIQLQNEVEQISKEETEENPVLQIDPSTTVAPEEEADFEESCWDPYCEKVQDTCTEEDTKETSNELLIDINGDQSGKDINSNVSAVTHSNADSAKSIVDTYRDDWNINMTYPHDLDMHLRVLRRTISCPSIPFIGTIN